MGKPCPPSNAFLIDAYTFRFLGGTFQSDELHRAEYYADRYALRLHYVDISLFKTSLGFKYVYLFTNASNVQSVERS